MFMALIRYFDRRTMVNAGNYNEAPHWALMHHNGRIDRFKTLAEAKAEAHKIQDRIEIEEEESWLF